MVLDKELLAILACPKCRGNLTEQDNNGEEGLKCETCKLLFPIKDGIPVLLIEDAVPLV